MNDVPGQPDFLPGKPQSLEELRRIDALARKLEGTARQEGLEVDNLGDSGSIPYDSGHHKLRGFPARITGQDSVTLSRYSFTETYVIAGVATSLPVDGGIIFSDSTTLAYTGYEINGRDDVPTDGSAVVMMYPADDPDTWWFEAPAGDSSAGTLTVTDGGTTVTGVDTITFDEDYFNVLGTTGNATVTMGAFPTGSSSPTTAPAAGSPIYFIQNIWNGTDWSDSKYWVWTGFAWLAFCPCDDYIPPDYPSIGTACCPDDPITPDLWAVFNGPGAAACLTGGNPWTLSHSLVGSDHYWYSVPDQNNSCNTPIDNGFRLRCTSGGVWSAAAKSTTGVGTCWGGSGTITLQTCDPFFVQGVIPLAGGGDGCGTGNVTFTITPPS